MYGVVGLLVLVIFALFFSLLYNKDDSFNFYQQSKKINSVFSKYDGKVYASVPSNGKYEVVGADLTTFKTLPEMSDAHIGFDVNHVYAGNIILDGLNPKTLKAIGNNYYTDGNVTYYCSSLTERNESLSAVGFVVQLMGYNLGISSKPQNYWYPFKEINQGVKYTATNTYGITVSENQAFYEGLLMPEANPQTIKPIMMREKSGGLRESTDYFTDGKRVFYHHELLPLSYNSSVHQIDIEGDFPSRNLYLMDEKTGMIYVDGKAFDSSQAPYSILSRDLVHAHHAMFVGNDGIYFYNTDSGKMERAGDLPFQEVFQEVAPDVFTSGSQVFYLKDSENRSNKRGTKSRSTHFLELKNSNAKQLKKISPAIFPYGSNWQSGDKYFYFDDLGSSQGMHSAVYEFKNPNTAVRIATSEIPGTNDIRGLLSSGELIEPEHEEVFKATTDLPDKDFKYFIWIFGIGFGVFLLVYFVMRNKNIAPYFIKDDFLIMNNLTFNRYKISDIEKVVFGTVKSNFRTGSGYSGKVHIVKKNGKTSRNFMFSSKITLLSQSEAEILRYIRELQKELRKRGIDSEVR